MLRWVAVLGGLAMASGALLVLYGVSLVDRALGGAGRPPCLRVTGAPWTLRRGEAWSPEWLGRVLDLQGLRDVTPAAPRVGEFSRHGQIVVVVGGPGAEPPGTVAVRCQAAGVSLEDAAGQPLSMLRLAPVTVGTTDADGVVRWPVSIAQVAPALLTAVVDIEDRTFLSHPGLSLRGLVRAGWRNLASGSVREGGSTITQQLAKNVLLRPVRSLPRKLLEAWLAALIDYRYDKRRILQAYLDRVYLGQDGGLQLHGVEAASHRLFGKRAAALNLEEAALVAGMIAAPNRFDPFTSPGEARRRRAAVLEAMVRAGHLAPADGRAAGEAPLPSVPHRLRWRAAASFVDLVVAEVPGAVGEVATHLEPSFQAAVAEGCAAGLRRIEAKYPHLVGRGAPLEVAVAVVAADGRVLATMGGRDPRPGDFNRAAAARRPVGSLAKPFVVAAALAAGRTLEDPLDDTPLHLPTPGGDWSPRNSDGTYRGRVSVREALVQSLNVPIVRLGMEVSLPSVEGTLSAVGFSPPRGRPAVLLGAFEASPLEVARAYATLLNAGLRPDLAFLATTPRRGRAALSPWVAQAVVEALSEVPRRGTASSLAPQLRGWLAAKTGTSDERRDSWFVGLRRGFVVTVWVGFDDNRETGLFGATGALEVWREIDARIPPAYRP